MSGGSMNCAYYEINNAANAIQRTLAEYTFRRNRGVLVQTCDYDIEHHPEAKHLHTPEALADSVISRLEMCLELVRKATVCAKRVEWLTSGDDDESSFCLRLDKDLANVEKTGGVE